jgi:hypothetical protein
LLLAALAPAGAGCGFAIVQGPPPTEARAAGWTCTTRYDLPVADAVVAGASAAVSFYGLEQPHPSKWLPITGFVSFAFWAASSTFGFKKVEACREAIAAHPGAPLIPAPSSPSSSPPWAPMPGD